MKTVRVVFCGGRRYADAGRVSAVMERLAREHRGRIVIIQGGANGADRLAAQAAMELGLTCETWPADWTRYGRGAGPIRNQAMLDSGADLVVAFPGGRGTADMVKRARAAGVPVVEV